jgi:hypothetical protein
LSERRQQKGGRLMCVNLMPSNDGQPGWGKSPEASASMMRSIYERVGIILQAQARRERRAAKRRVKA